VWVGCASDGACTSSIYIRAHPVSLTTTPEVVAAPNYSAVSIGSTPFA
jgi:hypothetical protein